MHFAWEEGAYLIQFPWYSPIHLQSFQSSFPPFFYNFLNFLYFSSHLIDQQLFRVYRSDLMKEGCLSLLPGVDESNCNEFILDSMESLSVVYSLSYWPKISEPPSISLFYFLFGGGGKNHTFLIQIRSSFFFLYTSFS